MNEAQKQTSTLRRGSSLSKWLLGVLLGVLLLGTALAVLEWMQWPFLRRPLEARMRERLQREVTLGEDFGVRFFGRLRLRTDLLVLGPAPGSPTQGDRSPELLRASQISLSIPYSTVLSLLRDAEMASPSANAPNRRIHIDSLVIGHLTATLIRGADGRANWDFGSPQNRDTAPAKLPEFGRLEVQSGDIVLDDAITRARITAAVRTRSRSGAASTGQTEPDMLEATARGTYRDQPLNAQLYSNGVIPLAESGGQAPPVYLRLEMHLGASTLNFDGTARDVMHLGALDGKFFLSGPSLAAVGDSLGVTLPTTAPFVMDGHATRDGLTWSADVRRLSLGSSRLRGTFRYDPTLAVPKLTGKLSGERLSLPDLGPAVGVAPYTAKPHGAGKAVSRESAGTQAQGPTRTLAPLETSRRGAVTTKAQRSSPTTNTARVLPQREFDIPSLAAMDADVAISLSSFHLGTDNLEQIAPLHAHVVLDRQVLNLKDITARTASGEVRGTILLDAREKNPLWQADLRWSGVQLEHFLKPRDQAETGQAHGYISGILGGQAKLRGNGRSTAQVLASLDGQMQLWVRNGRISHFLVEVVGLDIAQGLGMLVRGDDTLPMSCAVAALDVRDGIARTQAAVIDTSDSTLSGTGVVSLADERLDFVFKSQPKDISPLALRAPVSIVGTFAEPEVKLQKTSIALRLAAAAALATVTPFASFLALVDLGEPEKKVCQDAIQRVQSVTAHSIRRKR